VSRRFGVSGESVLIEEHLVGEEASVQAFSDGRHVAYLVPSQDHKRALDGDCGPNTGGMGAYAPVPAIDAATMSAVSERIVEPIISAMADHGTPYRGLLYAGLMLTDRGPMVIEINCRFGDPEAQVVLPLLNCDIVEIMLACVRGELDPATVTSGGGASACVVMASGGYPGTYKKGEIISGLETADSMESVVVFHAGTSFRADDVVTSGGRVLGVTGLGLDLPTALDRAYVAVGEIGFQGAAWRKDIGSRALSRLREGERLPQGS
jgi:phosphoribosylamine--glycine ligase